MKMVKNKSCRIGINASVVSGKRVSGLRMVEIGEVGGVLVRWETVG